MRIVVLRGLGAGFKGFANAIESNWKRSGLSRIIIEKLVLSPLHKESFYAEDLRSKPGRKISLRCVVLLEF